MRRLSTHTLPCGRSTCHIKNIRKYADFYPGGRNASLPFECTVPVRSLSLAPTSPASFRMLQEAKAAYTEDDSQATNATLVSSKPMPAALGRRGEARVAESVHRPRPTDLSVQYSQMPLPPPPQRRGCEDNRYAIPRLAATQLVRS